VPVAYHERVFGIFERLEPRQGDRGGTGIGLAICRKIVEQLDGRIEFADQPDRPDQPAGTTVVVTLPAAALALPAAEWPRALEHQS
jgi:signal transduction histidine kinase